MITDIAEQIDPNSPKKIQDIFVEDGVIKEIGENLEYEDVEMVQLQGKMVLSGMIDMHCNICDPGFEHIENIESASESALRGGFTSITCEPNTNPVIDNKTVVEYIVSKSKSKAKVNIFPYGSMSVGCKGEEMGEIGDMAEAGIVAISDGDQIVEQASFLRNVMLYTKMFDLPIITHCEDKALSGVGVMNAGFYATSLGLIGIPHESEEITVARNILLAEATGAKLHISHVTTKLSVQLIREAKQRGMKNLTAETSPHYFLLTEEDIEIYNTLMKVRPPLRTQSDIEAILEGIADGTIDVIASSHSPFSMRDKDKLFPEAINGISSFETLFCLCYTYLVEKGIISLERLMEMTSKNPAHILNLHKKGEIAVGNDADFIVVDLEQSFSIEQSQFLSRAKFSPFQGYEVKGRVIASVVAGAFQQYIF